MKSFRKKTTFPFEINHFPYINTAHQAKYHLRTFNNRYQRKEDLKAFWDHCKKLGISCKDGVWIKEE